MFHKILKKWSRTGFCSLKKQVDRFARQWTGGQRISIMIKHDDNHEQVYKIALNDDTVITNNIDISKQQRLFYENLYSTSSYVIDP